MATKARPIVIIDRYTRAVIARYPSVKEAARDLAIPSNTIYQCLCARVASYDSYCIYENEIGRWSPAEMTYMRVNGLKVSERLEELRKRIRVMNKED